MPFLCNQSGSPTQRRLISEGYGGLDAIGHEGTTFELGCNFFAR
jgi:hypothetical protein